MALNFPLRIPFNAFPNRKKSQPTLWFQCISTNRSWSLLLTHNDVILFLYDVSLKVGTITIHHIWSSGKLKDSVFQFLINSKWLKYCITSPGRHEPTQTGHWRRSETWSQWVYWSYSHEQGVTCRNRVTPRQIHPQSPLSTGDSSKKLHSWMLTGLGAVMTARTISRKCLVTISYFCFLEPWVCEPPPPCSRMIEFSGNH